MNTFYLPTMFMFLVMLYIIKLYAQMNKLFKGIATNCDNEINKLPRNIIVRFFTITMELYNDFVKI